MKKKNFIKKSMAVFSMVMALMILLCQNVNAQYTIGGSNEATGTISNDDLACSGATVTVAAGILSGSDTYVWSDATIGDNQTFDRAFTVGEVFTATITDGSSNQVVQTINVALHAATTVSFTAPADLCLDAGNQTGLGGGTPAQGTATGDIGVYGGPGVTDDGNGMTYSFNPATAGVGTHTLTYTYTDDNGCVNSATDMIEVFALPTPSFTALGDLCVDAAVQTGLGGGTPTGGMYSGSGVTDDGNGMTYTFDPAAAGVGTHTITYDYTDTNGCTGSSTDDVEVFALPVVMFTAPADLCVDAAVQTGLGGGTPTGGVYSGSGVTDDGNGTSYSFNPATAGVGTHTLTYTFTDGNGCENSASDDVEVFALPNVTFTAPVDVCLNNGLVALTGGSPAQGTVSGDIGVYSGMGVIDNGDGTYDLDPAAAGAGMHTLTYEYTDGNGCVSSATDDIEVFGLSIVAFTALDDLCLNAGLQEDEGTGTGTPYGGVYTGPGVSDNGDGLTYDFDPATAGVGTHTIVYTFTDANGCMETAEDDVVVIALPALTFTALADACIDAGLQSGSGATPSGGVYSGPGVADGADGMNYSFDPAAAGLGTHTITYSYTDATTGCANTATDDVVVFALPVVLFTAPADLCVDAGTVVVSGGAPTGGIYSGTGVTESAGVYSFDPSAAGVGVHTITYTYTDGNGCTNSASDDVEVFALPVLSFTAVGDVCIDAGAQSGSGATPTGGVYSGTGVTDGGDGMTYSFDPSAAGVGIHTITYTYTDGNGCTNSASDDVEVFALPVLSFTAVGDVCVDAGAQSGSGATPTGGVYSGTGVTDGGDGMNYSFDPSVGANTYTITYSYTDATTGCTNTITDDVEVFALPAPTFTALADLCVDAGVQSGLSGGMPLGSGGVYSGAGVSDNGDGTFDFDPSGATVGTHTITFTYTDANGCSASASDDVEVFGLPVVNFSALADLCIDGGVQTGLGGGMPSGTGGVYSGNGVTDGGDGLTYSFDPATATAGIHSLTYTYTDATTGCSNSTSDVVEVFALPVVTFTGTSAVCINEGVQAGLGGGTPSGTGGVYSGPGVTDDGDGMTFSFDPIAVGAGMHTLTYTYTDGNGCENSDTDIMTVYGVTNVTFTTTLSDLCENEGLQSGLGGGLPSGTGGVYSGDGVIDGGDGLTYDFDPAIAGAGTHTITYSFTDANGCIFTASDDVEVIGLTGLAFTAVSDVCVDAGSQSGSGATPPGGVYSGPGVTDSGDGMNYSFDPSIATVGTHTITYTYTDATTGCTSTATDDVEVFDLPTVAFTAPADLCVDAGVQASLGGGTSTGGVYSGAGVTDDANGMTYSFDPAAAGVGVHTITYAYTDGNGCMNSASDDVEVFDLPVVTFTAPSDLCVDAGVQAALGGGTSTGGVYSGAGVTDDANGMTYSFDPAAAGVGVHTITYDYTDGNGCMNSASDDVEVFDLPVVMFTAPSDLCVDAGVQATLGGGTSTGGVYSGAGVTDDANGMTYSFDPAAAGVGVHTITYDYTDGNGCMNSASDDVEVFDLPVVMFTAPVDLCINEGNQTGLSGGTPAQGAVIGDVGVYSGPGVTDGGDGTSYSFDPASAGPGTHTIMYTYTDANGCSASATDDVVVFGITPVTFTAPSDLCIDGGVQAGLGGGMPTGGVYSGAGVTDDANGMTYSFDPATAGANTHTITYTHVDGNSCTNSASDDVEVFALPVVAFTPPSGFCIDAGVQAGLGGATPMGGVYSGDGVTDDGNGMTYSFDPDGISTGVGNYTLTYTYTDGNGCTAAASGTTDVFALPTVTFSGTPDFCVDAGVQAGLSGGSPAMGAASGDMGVYSGPGVTDNGDGTFDFDPAAAAAGPTTLTYTYTDGDGCEASATDDIVVFGLSIVTFVAPSDLCIDAGVQSGLTGGTPPGGIYGGPGVTDNGDGTYDFDPSAAGAGVHTLSYTHTDGNSCTVVKTDDVEVFALPVVMFTAPSDLCVDAGVQAALGGGMPTGAGTYSGTGVSDNGDGTYDFDPSGAGIGTHTITFTYTDGNGCSASTTDDVDVFGLPTVTFTALSDLCGNAGIQSALSGGMPAGAGGVYAGTGVTDNGDGTFDFDPSGAGAGTHTITFTYTDGNGCSASTTDDVEVFANPTVSFIAPADICIEDGVQTGLMGGTPAQGTVTGDVGVYSGTGVTDDGNGMTYSFDPSGAGVGTHTITYTYTDENGCQGSASDDVEVIVCHTFAAAFESTWEVGAGESITIPTNPGFSYNYTVDWGDGTMTTHNGDATHTYSSAGVKVVKIDGDFPAIYFNNAGDKDKIRAVVKWGDIAWESMERAFSGVSNFYIISPDDPDLSGVTNMSRMFFNATNFNEFSNIDSWDVSNVTDMSAMFQLASNYNGNIDNWNVSNVENMSAMFAFASVFNRDLSSWDVSSVTDMSSMFTLAGAFDQDLGGWDVEMVTTMKDMLTLSGLSDSNYDNTLIGWESQAVQNGVELGAISLEYCAGDAARTALKNSHSWDITGDAKSCPVIGFTVPFITTWETTSANEDILIKTAGGGFDYTVDWGDGNITSGHTTSATHSYVAPGVHTVQITGVFPQIYMMGAGASRPKLKSIEQWGDNEWRSMGYAFANAVNVVNNATDIPNTSNVQTMAYMFYNAKQFDADLGSWDIENVTSMTHALSYAGLSTSNYDNTLIGWESQSVKSGVRLDARTLEYCSAIVERGNLIANSSWTIYGDSQCPLPMQSISNQIATLNGEEVELSTTTFEQVRVFPNPTNGELTMVYDLSTDQEVEILVRDVTGKLLYKVEQMGVAGENQATLNLSANKNGMYLLQLTNGEQSLTKRVVKQ